MRLFDADVRLGHSLFGYELDEATLSATMKRLDIERAVVCPVRPKNYDLRAANDDVIKVVQSNPSQWVGFARVDPWQEVEAVAEVRRAVTQGGLRGVFLDPWEDHFSVSASIIDPIVETATSLGIPIMVAAGYPQFSHPSQIAALARRHPNATFIATHGGQINISGLLLTDAQIMLRTAPNVLINTSGVYREDFIEDCVDEFGAHRVLFGSGSPIFDQGFEVLRVLKAHLADETKEQIGWKNISQLVDGVTPGGS